MFGYHGCYLFIDLSNETTEQIPLPEALLQEVIGGEWIRSLVAYATWCRSGRSLLC